MTRSLPPIQARPTIYAGIQMRSRLEASFAAILDRYQLRWEYEPVCYASPQGQYLPDFKVENWSIPLGDVPCFIEIKPYVEDERRLQRKMEIIWATEPRAELMLVVGDNREMYVAHGHEDGGVWYHQYPTIWSPGYQPVIELIRDHDLAERAAAAEQELERAERWHRLQAARFTTATGAAEGRTARAHRTGAAGARRALAEAAAVKE